MAHLTGLVFFSSPHGARKSLFLDFLFGATAGSSLRQPSFPEMANHYSLTVSFPVISAMVTESNNAPATPPFLLLSYDV